MLSALYLLTSFLAGLAVVQRLFGAAPVMVRLAGAFVGGIVVSAWLTFLVAFGLSPLTESSVLVGILAAIVVHVAVIGFWGRDLRPSMFHLAGWEVLFVGGSLALSFWLMDSRLGGDPLLVSGNTWGDTALHVALARSFALGHNFPPEYPFFGNEPIRYHFGYDFFAGALEEGGLSVVHAFNLPGALAFASIMMLVFELGRSIFRKAWVGLIAVVILVTNGSLAFLRYFELYNNNIGKALLHLFDRQEPPFHDRYLAVGPYLVEGRIDKISIFMTLNVFLTQTHLIVAMAVMLFAGFLLVQPLRRGEAVPRAWALALGVLVGLSFWMNGVLYAAAMVFFGALFAVFAAGDALEAMWAGGPGTDLKGRLRQGWPAARGRVLQALPFLAPAVLLAVPQAVWLNGGLGNEGSVQWHLGYLVCSSPEASCHDGGFNVLALSSWWDFIEYWWLNLGLTLPLMVLAAVWAGKQERKLMLAVMAVFIFGSLVQLSRDLGGHNHKVFNLWEILMGVFAAFGFVYIWDLVRGEVRLRGRRVDPLLRWGARATLPVVFVLLVLSGIIDFMVIKNDGRFEVFGDKTETIERIAETTRRDSIILTTYGELYTAPTMAGRRIFLGYEPWVASAGYDLEPRKAITAAVYGASTKDEACRLLLENEIDYVLVSGAERNSGRFPVNEGLFAGSFTPTFSIEARDGPAALYDVGQSCGQAAAVARS